MSKQVVIGSQVYCACLTHLPCDKGYGTVMGKTRYEEGLSLSNERDLKLLVNRGKI